MRTLIAAGTGPQFLQRTLGLILLVLMCRSQVLVRADESQTHVTESGPVVIRLQLGPESVKIGDLITLIITVEAENHVEVLMPEFGEALDRFGIIDFVPRETIDGAGKTILEQRYRLRPTSSGAHTIPPILVEYVDRRPNQRVAPVGLDAYEILTEAIPFEVASVLPEDAENVLRPPLGRIPLTSPGVSYRLPWILSGLLLLILGGFVVYTSKRWRQVARRRSAYEIARSRLDQLLDAGSSTPRDVEKFYVTLSSIVRQYLEDRFELRAPDLTTEEFLVSVVDAPDLSSDHQHLLQSFLNHADLVKFARILPSTEDVERSIDSAVRFLDETRDNVPFLSVNEGLHTGESLHESTAKGTMA